METVKYKVKVLHFINPHLIWVLVKKEGESNTFSYEQIGIHGISPLDIKINFDGNVETKRSDKWLPAVSLMMQTILSSAVEVWFSVTYLDKSTSIFDDNLHKYGDLFIKDKDGKTFSMRDELLDTGVVIENLNFHQDLNTKLDYITTKSVIKKLKRSVQVFDSPKRHLEDVLNKQTSVVRQIIELEDAATVNNPNTQLLLRKHVNDLNACKDVDEKSIGRAVNTKNTAFNKILTKKLSLIKSRNAVVEPPSFVKNENTRNNLQFQEDNVKPDFKERSTPPAPWEPYKNIKIKQKEAKMKAQNSDKGKKFMALGPPGLNPLQYRFKEVIKEKEIVETRVIETKPKGESEVKEDVDDFDNIDHIDSEVNVKIDDLTISKLKVIVEDTNNKNKKSNSCDVNSEKKSFVEKQNFVVENKATNRKMQILKQKIAKLNDSSSTGETDSAVRKGDDSDSDSITSLVNKLDLSYKSIKKEIQISPDLALNNVKNNVNPFKNLDGSRSIFVDKLISPTLMVHTKNGNRVQPVSNLRDLAFGADIHGILQNMSVKIPMRSQTVSWPLILRGHSLFLVSPCGSGKTMGYLPAVCRLVNDCRQSAKGLSITPLSCIIVCATAKSVSHTEELCKMFLHNARIFACYTGMTDISISTSLLNGCNILISTPTLLVRIMRDNLGLDLRNLNTFVIDDCERIEEVYQNDLKYCLFKVKEMLKNRANKVLKVQYVVTSRIWCDFMSSLAKKAPDSIICIAAFQECVLYSKVDTSVEFLKKENKLDALVNFLENIVKSKKTVIACRSDDEVRLIEKSLTKLKYIVFACDSTMTLHDLYSLDLALNEYQEPILGPILVCCDSNLTHLNITDAHYLVHFSLPLLFSMFCRRFAVLSDNYQSIFNKQDVDVKIKMFLEDSNVEQLPKILNFIKRCSDSIPALLDQISDMMMVEKDLKKAEIYVPLCNALLTLGKCPDLWNCRQRHTLFKEFDEPKSWLPKEGVITFKILHYHSAVHYSARMLSCVNQNGVKKYMQTYSMVTVKLGMYYSKESNRKLHGKATPGDICGVSLKLNLFARCQVMKVLKYTDNNIPCLLLINLIDEEKYEIARDTCLYYLPDELKNIETQTIQVILSNIAPEDRDITYSKIAENELKKVTETNEDLYMRANISLVIRNCIFVDTLEACQDLSSLNETVVKSNFRNELLEGHAIINPDHIKVLEKLGSNLEFVRKNNKHVTNMQVSKPIKVLPKARWAHLESDNHAPVYYLHAKSPGSFFVQHVKFQDCLHILIKDIKKYVTENPEPINDVKEGDIVLAEFPDDKCYERARIDSVIDDTKVNCFFVDLGDWAIVSVDKVLSITEKLIIQLPFQAIECRLVGIKPVGENWSEFSTNWLVDQFYDTSSNLKYLFAKRFTRERATFTEGSKYGIGLIDTYAEDVYINKLMIDANLAKKNDEIEFLSTINIESEKKAHSDDSDLNEDTYLSTDGDEPTEKTVSNVHQLRDIESKYKAKVSSQYKQNKCEKNVIPKIYNKEVDKSKRDEKNEMRDVSKHFNSGIDKENESYPTDVIGTEGKRESSPDSEKDMCNEQQTALNLFCRKPLRSIPLVDNDDIDDDRWDSVNPFIMLSNPNQMSNVLPTIQNVYENKIKKTPAICFSKVDTQSIKEEDTVSDLSLDSEQTSHKSKLDEVIAAPNTLQQSIDTVDKQVVAISHPVTSVDNKNNIIPKTISKGETNSQNKSYYTITESNNNTLLLHDEISPDIFKEIKLTWYQDNKNINMKIHVSTKIYKLVINDKIITFYTNDTDYGFELELYDYIDAKNSIHTNKGTYIDVNFVKATNNNWLNLNSGNVKKIIIDNITTDINENKNCENYKDKVVSKITSTTIDTVEEKSELKEHDKIRKPKLVWQQNKNKVTVKIQLITDKYDLNIKDKNIEFHAYANDEEYAFDFELCGVVDIKKSTHSNKGQYILVNLFKIMPKNWFTLSEGNIKKWIVYDVDGIDVSSDEDDPVDVSHLRASLNINHDSDSDDSFVDDIDFSYKKNY